MMVTLYLSPGETEDSQLLWRACEKMGWDVFRLSWALMNHLAPQEVKEKVLYGEEAFIVAASEALGVEVVVPPVDFLLRLPREMVKREVGVWNKDSFPSNLGPIFVKSLTEAKLSGKGVRAAVYDKLEELGRLSEWVMTSEPVSFEIEFRGFCSDGKLRTLAPYLREGKLVEYASTHEWLEAEAFLNAVAAVTPYPCVVDVGKIVGRGWAVVGVKSATSSRLVGCDPWEALKVMRRAIKKEVRD